MLKRVLIYLIEEYAAIRKELFLEIEHLKEETNKIENQFSNTEISNKKDVERNE